MKMNIGSEWSPPLGPRVSPAGADIEEGVNAIRWGVPDARAPVSLPQGYLYSCVSLRGPSMLTLTSGLFAGQTFMLPAQAIFATRDEAIIRGGTGVAFRRREILGKFGTVISSTPVSFVQRTLEDGDQLDLFQDALCADAFVVLEGGMTIESTKAKVGVGDIFANAEGLVVRALRHTVLYGVTR